MGLISILPPGSLRNNSQHGSKPISWLGTSTAPRCTPTHLNLAAKKAAPWNVKPSEPQNAQKTAGGEGVSDKGVRQGMGPHTPCKASEGGLGSQAMPVLRLPGWCVVCMHLHPPPHDSPATQLMLCTSAQREGTSPRQ